MRGSSRKRLASPSDALACSISATAPQASADKLRRVHSDVRPQQLEQHDALSRASPVRGGSARVADSFSPAGGASPGSSSRVMDGLSPVSARSRGYERAHDTERTGEVAQVSLRLPKR